MVRPRRRGTWPRRALSVPPLRPHVEVGHQPPAILQHHTAAALHAAGYPCLCSPPRPPRRSRARKWCAVVLRLRVGRKQAREQDGCRDPTVCHASLCSNLSKAPGLAYPARSALAMRGHGTQGPPRTGEPAEVQSSQCVQNALAQALQPYMVSRSMINRSGPRIRIGPPQRDPRQESGIRTPQRPDRFRSLNALGQQPPGGGMHPSRAFLHPGRTVCSRHVPALLRSGLCPTLSGANVHDLLQGVHHARPSCSAPPADPRRHVPQGRAALV
jgi:hypothetical protein